MSKPIQTVEELDAVLHWRGKHAQAIRERDALQLDLNQRDEQIATLDLQREAHLRNSQVAERRVGVLEGLLREAKGVFGEFAGSSSIARKAFRDIEAALKPAEDGGDEYPKSREAAHKAMSMENQRITPCNPDENEPPCSACFVRGCNGECMENL